MNTVTQSLLLGCFLVLQLVLSVPTLGQEKDLSDLYSEDLLNSEKERIKTAAGKIWNALQLAMTPIEKTKLRGLRFKYPLTAPDKSPVTFSSDARARSITLPISSLMFVEDLALARAWLYLKQFKLDAIEHYVSFLKYKNKAEFPGGKWPHPLDTMGVPRDAWKDETVLKQFLEFRNRAWSFIIAHEAGHILRKHPSYRPGIPRRQIQLHEKQADEFAADLMSRPPLHSFPFGAFLFFSSHVLYFPNRADFGSNDEYKTFIEERLTHPVTSDRIQALSNALLARIDGYMGNEKDHEKEQKRPIYVGLANDIKKYARILDDDAEHQRIMRYVRSAPLSFLKPTK